MPSTPLSALLAAGPLGLSDFLPFAIQLSGLLANHRDKHLTHLCPQTILWDADAQQLALAQTEMFSPDAPLAPDDLPYIAPEQTGRISHAVDHRANLYSLGTIFYHCLTGGPPFVGSEPGALIQAHLAIAPAPPITRCAHIPGVLSDMVLKLLQKNPEDRYQSALGLQIDLQECQDRFHQSGDITPFDLGRLDHIDTLQISNKLYGRAGEVEMLMRMFEDIDVQRVTFLLISGYSGVGKTSLIHQLLPAIDQHGGIFLSGKFDQAAQNVPFQAISQAFQSLVRKTLASGDAHIAQVKARLHRALGNNGKVITDLLPELERLIGPQPDVPELAPDATQNRFHFVFQNFVSAFTDPANPLVLFLDDLQWIDTPSLALLNDLITRSELKNILLIGAYRDNEVGPDHPLTGTITAIKQTSTPVCEIHLQPIDPSDLNLLIADTLGMPDEQARPLSEAVYAKTRGNPFFVKTLIRVLYESRLLTFEHRQWTWNLPAIQQLDVSENVAEFLAHSIQNLPRAIRQSLQYAACIGNRFDLHIAADAQGKNIRQTALELEAAVRMSLIAPISESAHAAEIDRAWPVMHTAYRFLHDRVQEAADRLLTADQRELSHLHIGRAMLADAKRADVLDDHIIDIVQHLNQGRDQFVLPVEKMELADLNLRASRKAKASAAFEQAYAFCRIGLDLLPPDAWQTHYKLALSLHEEAAETAYLVGDYERMEHFSTLVHQKAITVLDRVNVYEIEIIALMAQGKLEETIEIGLQALRLLGMELPNHPDRIQVDEEIQTVLALLTQKSNQEILQQPEQKQVLQIAIHRILSVVSVPSYHADHNLHLMLISRQVCLSIQFGNTKYSPLGYALYGAMFSGDLNHMDIAFRLSELIPRLTHQLSAREHQTRLDWVIYGFMKPWSVSLRDIHRPIRDSIDTGKNTGDIDYTARLMCFSSTFCILSGEELNKLDDEIASDRAFLARLGLPAWVEYMGFYRQCTLNLLGKSQIPHILAGEGYDETQLLERDLTSGHGNMIVVYGVFKTIFCYLFDQYQQAVHYNSRVEPYLPDVAGMIFIAIFHFYDSLSLLAVYLDHTAEEQRGILDKVAANQEKIKAWAEHAPMNHLHKYWLVEAEKARVLSQHRDAAEYYDKAIDLARQHRYINEEALANERAAYFYEQQNRPRLAELYLREAYRCYEAWGAKAKTDHLAERYPHWVGQQPASPLRAQTLDADALIRASQTFSSTPIAADMLRQLMALVMENAGAQRGLLLLQKRARWVIEAEVSVDPHRVDVLQEMPLDPDRDPPILPHSAVQYALRTRQPVLLDDAVTDPVFGADRYIQQVQLRSLLCLPVLHRGQVLALLYLENRLTRGVFTPQRVQVLNIMASQAAISLDHVLHYEEQFRQVHYLYRLRSALGRARTTRDIIQCAGQCLQDMLADDPDVSVHIDVGQDTYGSGVMTGARRYAHPISWGSRERGRLQIACAMELDDSQQHILLDETAGQLAYALEARELQMQLLQSARLVSLGQMAASVAHELNQPLGGISATAEDYYLRLEEGMDVTQDQIKASFKRILSMVERMNHTVEHLRAFSRDPSLESGQSIDLNTVIHDSLDIIGAQLKNHGIQVDLYLSDDLPTLIGHPFQVEQVFLNLFSNARDALDAHGPLSGKRIAVRTRFLDHRLIAEVEDNGTGIAPEYIDRIFEPFFTTKSAEKGTGLGLAITSAIVHNHGGDITCVSTPGKGTTFSVAFPVAS